MKLFEKLKNTFFEEEYVEVEEPKEEPKKKEEIQEEVAKKVEVKEEPRKVEIEESEQENTAELNKVFEEIDEEELEEPIYSDREILSRDTKLSYFDDDDFVDEYYEKKEVEVEPETKKIYGGSANSVYDSIINSENEHKPYGESAGKFHPTPIISPIYGVLDKNYRKEEVVDKKDRPSSYVSRRDVDLDSVRKKAYGDVSILENREPEERDLEDTQPLLYDMIDIEENEKPAVDKVTIADAEEYFEDLGLEYNVDYKDSSYEDATRKKTRSTRTEKHQNEDIAEIDEIANDIIASDVSNTEDEDDSYDNLDENLFDLVDSVYKDGE